MIQGCHCDDGYYGHNCALVRCPHGDDPFTKDNENEVQNLICKAVSGNFHLAYKGAVTDTISFDDTIATLSQKLNALETMVRYDYQPVNLTSTGSDKSKVCTTGGTTTIAIEFQQESGDVPMIILTHSTLAHSSQSPSLTISEATKGNKEDLKCGGRGMCDEASGTCTCAQYYQTGDGYGNAGTKGDCSYATTAIGACPGEIPCSGHGVCSGSPTYQCQCAEGWESGDCSERNCLSGLAWFSFPVEENKRNQKMECSNQGWCDRSTGTCNCFSEFTGGNCQYMRCPGDDSCSGHGQCLNMAQLAQVATLNGDATSFSYGNTPNDVKTWDFQSIVGCHCDTGWEGYDCSLRSCPTGDDFNTMKQDIEVQIIHCTALPQHSFKLGFRQFETEQLYGSSTIETVVEELNKLSSIGNVEGVLIHASDPYITLDTTDPADLDPCRCAEDGIMRGDGDSPDIYTGKHGCKNHDGDGNLYCYPVDPTACGKPTPAPTKSPSVKITIGASTAALASYSYESPGCIEENTGSWERLNLNLEACAAACGKKSDCVGFMAYKNHAGAGNSLSVGDTCVLIRGTGDPSLCDGKEMNSDLYLKPGDFSARITIDKSGPSIIVNTQITQGYKEGSGSLSCKGTDDFIVNIFYYTITVKLANESNYDWAQEFMLDCELQADIASSLALITIGSSDSSANVVHDSGFKTGTLVCPLVVDKINWYDGDGSISRIYGNVTFSVAVSDYSVSVTRTDLSHAWDFNLRFYCWLSNSTDLATASPTVQFAGKRPCDPCSCAEDGVSGGVATNMYGCGLRIEGDNEPLCVVVDPTACTASKALEMDPTYKAVQNFAGAWQRSCKTVHQRLCSGNGDLLLKLKFTAPLGDLPDISHSVVSTENGDATGFVFNISILSDGATFNDVVKVPKCDDAVGFKDNSEDTCSSYKDKPCNDIAHFEDEIEMNNVKKNCARTCGLCDDETRNAFLATLSSLRGTVENAECNNRGTCNHQTGLCTCFPGFGSSDGLGNEGTLGDCGYLKKYISVA
jgi:hypothetical protein